MNGFGLQYSGSGRTANSSPTILSDSGFRNSGFTGGSNYNTNAVFGHNLSSQSFGSSYVLPSNQRTTFANDTSEKVRLYENAPQTVAQRQMYAAQAGVKTQEVTNPAQNTSAGIVSGLKLANSAVQTGLMASGMAPISLAIQASQAVGEAITGGLTSSARIASDQDFVANSQKAIVGGDQAARTLQTSQQNKIQSQSTGASIGALFGPLGALAGWAIGGAIAPDYKPFQVNSFEGKVDPSDRQIAASASTASPSGETILQDTL